MSEPPSAVALAASIETLVKELDAVMRDSDTALEHKPYYIGIFVAEIKRICDKAMKL